MSEHAVERAPSAGDALRPERAAAPGTGSRRETHGFALSAAIVAVPLVADDGAAVEPEVLLASVFGMLLARWTAQSSIPLRASRWSASGESIRTRSARLNVTLETTCLEVLTQTEAELHRLDRVPWVAPGSEDSGSANAGFDWVEARPRDEGDAEDLVTGSPAEPDGETLRLVITDRGGALRAAFVYDPDAFTPTSIERFSGHLGVVLAAVVAGPHATVFSLPLLTPAERQDIEAMCDGWPRALSPVPVHRQIELRTLAVPDAVALRHRDRCLSYGELNTRANRLSHRLIADDIGPESRVVVSVEPGFDILIALLGILKAGAVYVPLDPTYPAPRVRAILGDTRPTLVITDQERLRDPLWGDVPTLAVDGFGDGEGLSGENAALPIEPDRTAYIFYTSGTTGTPKGVMASHANLTSYVTLARERYGITTGDVMPAIARFSFSISLFELLVPLSAGGTVIILDRDHVVTPARMAETLREVTLFHAGPSLLRGLLAYIKHHHQDFSPFFGVRHASSGGDTIPAEVLEDAKEVFPSAEVFVIYGCSEIACMGCTYPVPRDRPLARTLVGRPFDTVSVRVLDSAFNVLPLGVSGEVFVSGSGVAKGYLNLPELTAERFVNIEGRRFYRTGDMGRLTEGGWLELLGRSDFQVKIRGMRVELGEIEHHLRRAPRVRDGVVMAREGTRREKVLVAYVVLEPDEGAADTRDVMASIRAHLTSHLPDYMVPALYVDLPSLPLNHNMKVDRRALPEPPPSHVPSPRVPGARAPESSTELLLASLWRKLLGVDEIGLDDKFFDLGGHSLLALDLIVQIDRALGVELGGMDVLRESLEVQASLCDERLGLTHAKSSPRFAPKATGADFELLHFGPDRSLYGVLHRPAGGGRDEAALICGPTGHEHVRAHFVLRRLAEQLAARGVPTLRFDYYGSGDSLGASIEGSCARWQRDIADALDEVRARTGARRVTAIGVRLGATLLWDLGDHVDVERRVFWDPVCDGSEYVAELERMHRLHRLATSDRWFPRRAKAGSHGTNLLGSTYSSAALAELRSLSMKPSAAGRQVPVRWLSTSPCELQVAAFRRIGANGSALLHEMPEMDCSWQDVARLEDLLPDVGISGALTALAMENP